MDMVFDTHMHCQRSCDSKMSLAEAVATAEKLNIGMCVTEHWDYDYPTFPQAFHFNVAEYAKDMAEVHSDKVLMGIEIGMMPHLVEKNTALARSAEFDYILCSIHCVQGFDIYAQEYYVGRDKKQSTVDYLQDMITCLKNHIEIDSLGHIDYMARYWPWKDEVGAFTLADAPDLFDQVFHILVERDIPMEINTRRFPLPGVVEELKAIYTRYKECGGKYVTLGSDAHNTDAVGSNIREAAELARSWGLVSVYYKQRRRELMQF